MTCRNPNWDAQQSAVRALYVTASRAFIPALIELLRSSEERICRTAEFGLETLTHHGAPEPDPGIDSPSNYTKWIHWWNANRQTATIFRYDQCGQIEMIK
jgi:HEAT repeat protein